MKNIIAKIVPISLAVVMLLALMSGCASVTVAKEELPVEELQQLAKEISEKAGELESLVRKMSKPSHAVPGDAGANIHTQFHRCEGFAMAVYDSAEELVELTADPEENRNKIRELAVEELWVKIGTEMSGGLAKAVGGMRGFIEQALKADPEDANALKCQDIIGEITDAQEGVRKKVSELSSKVQYPIVWEYPCMGPINPRLLNNGNYLIPEAFADRVIEVTPGKEIIWEYTGVVYPADAHRLLNGNTLIADKGNNRIIEVTPDKEIIWEYLGSGGEVLYGVQPVANGNVLIVDQGSPNRIIEVSPDKETVWEYLGDDRGFYYCSLGHRLENGNTLISEFMNHRIMDVTLSGEIVWEYSSVLVGNMSPHRLANGNTIITDCLAGFVIEVTPDKEIVWKYGAIYPTGAYRLENGNTLIADFGTNRVIEVATP